MMKEFVVTVSCSMDYTVFAENEEAAQDQATMYFLNDVGKNLDIDADAYEVE